MKVLIIEDEVPAAEKLERYLHRYDENIEVVDRITSVSDAVQWLKNYQDKVELIFMDIQLTDGKSFDIFKEVTINKPIIFITAFDDYAIDAFKVNSIDYLLKPITFADLTAALEKLTSLKQNLGSPSAPPQDINSTLQQLSSKTYKNRFMVKLGEHIKSITTDNIEFFYAEGRNVYLITGQNRKFIIDYKLEELEELLDPVQFFRVNRSFIMNINAIEDVVMYSNSRLKITPCLTFDKEIIVSREKVNAFKDWFNGL
ncbi:Two-component system response regulator [Fulvivirga imtechensis AK7]|uniref:Two-component system response regulator n=1 Tax=Fulvivirga imtechensis AK7 TaxID=1237149 RepID=L8JXG4_9BACT|nr:LytTR family DNA-binding domain-containing protein [Fulvivirga imtechensis]ELR72309.1 Two-component system response regulator [Fulvivirga imtechensis AK7]